MIRLLLTAALALFVLSLPLGRTKLGAQLRAAAGVCFVLALLPALVAGLFFQPVPAVPGHADPAGVRARIGTGLSCLGALVILSVVAYAILALRKKFFPKKKDPWEIFFARQREEARAMKSHDLLFGDPKAAVQSEGICTTCLCNWFDAYPSRSDDRLRDQTRTLS